MEPFRLAARAERAPLPASPQNPGLPPHGAPDPGEISRSWQRSRIAGLTPEQSRLDAPHHGQAERRLAAERNAVLVGQARPVISYFYGQIKDSGCVLLLSDAQGFLLDAAGDTDFCHRAAKVALAPGACWAEDQRGTNAIGTALVEGKPIVVNGSEHYLRSNNFLACAAAPLTTPGGQLLGVIDISCDARIYHPHTFGLVRAAAQMIENRIFELSFTHHTKLRFHVSRDCLGSMMEGAIALGEDGKILGANRAAFTMLGLRPGDIGTRDAASCFDTSLAALVDLARQAQDRPLRLPLRQGGTIHATLEMFHAPLIRAEPAASRPAADALAALDTGDAQITKAIAQLRRVLPRKLPILLQGETGTGKAVFAQALHQSGPRRQNPFITVSCATRPEPGLEAELFGPQGRLKAATGGVLFLDDVGELPPALQARLLHTLEEGTFDIALISASAEALPRRIEAKIFRADLYYHLAGLAVTLPPLRERNDLAALITRILARESAARGTALTLAPGLAAAFAQHDWPGNLRQLAGWLRTAVLLLDEDETEITLADLGEDARRELAQKPAPATPSTSSLRAQSDAVIANAVEAASGNIAAAARHLGISRNTLYRRLAAMRAD